MASHHDIFFKQTFLMKEHVIDFVNQMLPGEISRNLDFSTLYLETTSYVDDALAEHFSDMVYSCSYGETNLKIALLFEHKSASDNKLPYQLLKYMIRIWESDIKQTQSFTPVVPIVLYHGKRQWKPGGLSTCFQNLPQAIAPYIPYFSYLFIDLSDYSDEDIKDNLFKLASLKISVLLLKHIFEPDILESQLRDFFEIGKRYFQEEISLNFLESVINYIFQATEIETMKIVHAIKPVTKKGAEIAMTTAEKLRQEGQKKGRQEGRQEGSYNTLYAILQTMRNNGMTDENIAKVMNLDHNLIKKILKREQVEIPLHLLS